MKCADCKTKPNLNRRVTIQNQKSDATTDANNEVDLTDGDSWETYATRWAAFVSQGGSERFASDMIQAGQTHRVWLRSDATTRAITPRMRMVLGTRKFNILAAVDVNEERQWVRLDVAEAV